MSKRIGSAARQSGWGALPFILRPAIGSRSNRPPTLCFANSDKRSSTPSDRQSDTALFYPARLPDPPHDRGWLPNRNTTPLRRATGKVALAANRLSQKGLSVSLTVIVESLSAQAEGVCFQCDCGDGRIAGGITDIALHDLIDFHRIKSTA